MDMTIRLENEDSSNNHFFLKLNANLIGVPLPSDMLLNHLNEDDFPQFIMNSITVFISLLGEYRQQTFN